MPTPGTFFALVQTGLPFAKKQYYNGHDMTAITIPGKYYTITTAGECDVTATVAGVSYTLCRVSNGQASFRAISDTVEINDETAYLQEQAPPFSTAPASAAGRGDTGFYSGEVPCHAASSLIVSPTEDEPTALTWFELNSSLLSPGIIDTITMQARGNESTPPLKLSLWQADASGRFVFLAQSDNAVCIESLNPDESSALEWQFDPFLCLDGTHLRIYLTCEEEKWSDQHSLLCEVTQKSDATEGYSVNAAGETLYCLPIVSLALRTLPANAVTLLSWEDDALSIDFSSLRMGQIPHCWSTGEFAFSTRASAPEIIWPPAWKWIDSEDAPSLQANTAYRFVVRNEGETTVVNLAYSYPLPS